MFLFLDIALNKAVSVKTEAVKQALEPTYKPGHFVKHKECGEEERGDGSTEVQKA